VRYRAIGCGYTWPARRLNAVVIAKAYGTTVTVAFVSATGMSDRAYEEPTTERTQTMGKTKDVRAAVEDELIFDPLVDPTDIRVQNLGGDVALNGTVPSYPQYQEAAAATRRVAGVTSVHNHLEVVLPPGDERSDPALTTAANNALNLTVTVPDTVEAMAHHGVITLTGTVQYGYQRTAAETTVAALTGVRNVKDDTDIAWDADPVDVTIAVQDALDRNALIPDDSDVVVDTDENTVTLTGHVRTWAEHDAVLDAAWMTPAVYDVDDQLVVTG
jgi:osmotically-inducible protein OsmY